jgi:hypothetical protein
MSSDAHKKPDGPNAAELSRALAARMETLAPELLPGGRHEGKEWRCGSISGEAGDSFGVVLVGPKRGLWHDFNGGDSGDAFDLVAGARFGGDKKETYKWAVQWLGLAASSPEHNAQTNAPPPNETAPPGAPDPEVRARQRGALRLFLDAQPSLAGTPAALYLAARGIDLAELGRQPRSLRFFPELWNRESLRSWPAIIAAITDGAGKHIATHRTWLAKDAEGVWRKAPLREPKMCLGPMAGGSIRLWRGASGKPLAQAPEGETVAIAEGIETALSVVIACPELRVLSAVSLGNMARVVLPAAVRTVILCADNDGNNAAAARGLARAVTHFAEGARVVRIARSPIGKDFNDALRAETTA